MKHRPVSANFKIVLVSLAIMIVISILFYMQSIVGKLQERERISAGKYVEALEYIANNPSDSADYTFYLDMVKTIDFPLLMTDRDTVPISSRNIDTDADWTPEETTNFLIEERDDMAAGNPPIVVKYGDSLMNYVYYGESELVKELRLLPYIEILVAGMFMLIGYIGFSYIKRTEQANIWVGMSKETAHQLGTPLSSLMGWLELLRSQADDPEAIDRTLTEMENDVGRLNRIALRFSKIGSSAQLDEQNLMATINKSADYYRKRTPQFGKKVAIIVPDRAEITARYNAELMEWVFENLMKNALDAMESNEGKIEFIISESSRHIIIDVRDNGKGLESRVKKEIFRPGYSTKKRGWGLGLSLSRRIVQDYHRGKLFVHDTSPGKGTTFRIMLPRT